jgi:hypothetical protein
MRETLASESPKENALQLNILGLRLLLKRTIRQRNANGKEM